MTRPINSKRKQLRDVLAGQKFTRDRDTTVLMKLYLHDTAITKGRSPGFYVVVADKVLYNRGDRLFVDVPDHEWVTLT